MDDRTPEFRFRGRRLFGAVVSMLMLIFIVASCVNTSFPDEQARFDIPGLTHFYPLTDDVGDAKGDLDGQVHSVTFDGDGANYVRPGTEVPDDDAFSAATHPLTVVATVNVSDWDRGADNNEYVNWLGKGGSGEQEWTFRYYIDGTDRERRVSFYAFNPDGGLGTGSYCSGDNGANDGQHTFVGVIDNGAISIWRDGVQCDSDQLDEFDVSPINTASSVWFGTRGDGTGHLVGSLRDVTFFDRALTAQEITDLS